MNQEELLKEIKSIDEEIKSYNLNDEKRRKERVNVINVYNEAKDGALKVVGLIAECEGKSLNKVLNERGFNFEDSKNS